MNKFGRTYQIEIEKIDGNILTITLPFTIEFSITRNALSSANVADFQIYNLSQSNRDSIAKNLNDNGHFRLLRFKAGYGDNLPVCFQGAISQCVSYKQSRVDMITDIQCLDGGLQFATAPTVPIQTFPKGTDIKKQMIPALINALPGNSQGQQITVGAIGNKINGVLSRSNSFSEHPLDVLKGFSGGSSTGFFIDTGKAYFLADNECVPPTGISVIDADAGLLETPIQEQTIIHFPMLMETRIAMAQRLTLKSETNPKLNHDYKVISLGLRGIISESVCGDAITNIGLFAPFKDSELVDVLT